MFCTHGPKVSTLIIAAFFVLLTASPAAAKGGHRPKPPAPSRPKPAVTVRRIADRHIEMPAVDLGPDRTLVYAYGTASVTASSRASWRTAQCAWSGPQDSESSWVASRLSERPVPCVSTTRSPRVSSWWQVRLSFDYAKGRPHITAFARVSQTSTTTARTPVP